MSQKCLVGIHKETGVVQIIASLKFGVEDSLKEIASEGCYPAIGDGELCREAFGKKIDHPRDLLESFDPVVPQPAPEGRAA